MPVTARLAERAGAIGLFGAALFNEPLIAAFDGMAAGVPAVFLYVFGVWAVLIALLARLMLRAPAPEPDSDERPDERPRSDARADHAPPSLTRTGG